MARGGQRPNAGRPQGRRNLITAAANATLTEMARAYTEEMLSLLVEIARGKIESSPASSLSDLTSKLLILLDW